MVILYVIKDMYVASRVMPMLITVGMAPAVEALPASEIIGLVRVNLTIGAQ